MIVTRPLANHHATKASISGDQSLMLFLSLNMIYDHQSPVKFYAMVKNTFELLLRNVVIILGVKFFRFKLSLLYFADKSAGDQ